MTRRLALTPIECTASIACHPAAPTLLRPPCCHPAATLLRTQPHGAICTPQAKARWLAGSGTPSWGVSEVDEAAELISKLKIEVSDDA